MTEQEYFHIELTKSVQIAVPLEQAAEVLTVEAQDLCPIPGVSPVLLGVVNQRGRLLWIADLDALLGLNKTRTLRLRRSPVLVVTWKTETEDLRLGCLAQQLRGIITCPPSDVQPVPPRLEQRMQHFFSAWLRPPGNSLLRLNVAALFNAIQPPHPSTTLAPL